MEKNTMGVSAIKSLILLIKGVLDSKVSQSEMNSYVESNTMSTEPFNEDEIQ